jgi:hypothetical protein
MSNALNMYNIKFLTKFASVTSVQELPCNFCFSVLPLLYYFIFILRCRSYVLEYPTVLYACVCGQYGGTLVLFFFRVTSKHGVTTKLFILSLTYLDAYFVKFTIHLCMWLHYSNWHKLVVVISFVILYFSMRIPGNEFLWNCTRWTLTSISSKFCSFFF